MYFRFLVYFVFVSVPKHIINLTAFIHPKVAMPPEPVLFSGPTRAYTVISFHCTAISGFIDVTYKQCLSNTAK